jgi:hypothetical protein
VMQVRPENTGHILGDMPANATFFLCHTAAMNHTPASGP